MTLPDPSDLPRLAGAANALADPIRLRMLTLMNAGGACCSDSPIVDCGAERPPGVCVCEFQELLGLGQSRISYHIRILKEAGFICEVRLGKWIFYACCADVITTALADLAAAVRGVPGEGKPNASKCCGGE